MPIAPPATTAQISMYRWRVCAMLLAATTINYIDRQVLGVLAEPARLEEAAAA